jgi:integrase
MNCCKTCAKPEDDHTSQFHAFERDNSLPLWIDWHSFRRSLSSRLYEQKEQDRNIQAVMGHADVRTTMAHYIKPILGSMERFSENEAKRTGQTSVQYVGRLIGDQKLRLIHGRMLKPGKLAP